MHDHENAVPSLRLLYLIDDINNPAVTLKAIGGETKLKIQLEENK